MEIKIGGHYTNRKTLTTGTVDKVINDKVLFLYDVSQIKGWFTTEDFEKKFRYNDPNTPTTLYMHRKSKAYIYINDRDPYLKKIQILYKDSGKTRWVPAHSFSYCYIKIE